jgi:hypothetical protein
MINTLWSRKGFALFAAILAVICVAGLVRPKPVLDSGLGDGWKCSRTAGILLTCSKRH